MPIVPKYAAWLLDEVNVIRIGDDTVTAATTVRNLGVYFDHHLDMNSQISHVYPVHVHIICATSTTSADIFPQQQRNGHQRPDYVSNLLQLSSL